MSTVRVRSPALQSRGPASFAGPKSRQQCCFVFPISSSLDFLDNCDGFSWLCQVAFAFSQPNIVLACPERRRPPSPLHLGNLTHEPYHDDCFPSTGTFANERPGSDGWILLPATRPRLTQLGQTSILMCIPLPAVTWLPRLTARLLYEIASQGTAHAASWA